MLQAVGFAVGYWKQDFDLMVTIWVGTMAVAMVVSAGGAAGRVPEFHVRAGLRA